MMKLFFKTMVFSQALGLLFLLAGCGKEKPWIDLPEIPLVESEYICEVLDSAIVYHTAPYNAFTDLAFYDGSFYLTFRSAREHGFDSTSSIKTMRSRDFIRWSEFSNNLEKGLDVRDPKFLLERDQLYLNYTTINPNIPINKKQLRIFKIDTGDKTSLFSGNYKSSDIWYWYTGIFQNEKLSMGYKDNHVAYYQVPQSSIPYPKCALDLPNSASEARFVTSQNRMYSAIRTKYKGILAVSDLSNICTAKLWQLPVYQLGGPNITVFDENHLLISGRELLENNNSGKNVKTSLFLFNTKRNTISKLLELPSFADNGYAGHVIKNDTIFVSYYDLHVPTGKAVIKTARIKIVKKHA
ncbi:hypothetical protein [Sphingobacterium sp. HMA12]|uniref:hypothetical protein n=1 Tax=Sphingobacterium sp. HMA12 TaxID=2050894 RepID=UPI000CE9EDDE|nr:hypothetical protein [Sphingobacterium sp. HMA12]